MSLDDDSFLENLEEDKLMLGILISGGVIVICLLGLMIKCCCCKKKDLAGMNALQEEANHFSDQGSVNLHSIQRSNTGSTGASLPPNWTMYRTDDGEPYYHNPVTNTTSWDRPTK